MREPFLSYASKSAGYACGFFLILFDAAYRVFILILFDAS